MPHYYFDLINGDGTTRDEEGVDLADLDAARDVAVQSARSIVAAHVMDGALELSGLIVVRTDDEGKVLELRFEDAVRPVEPQGGPRPA